MTTQKTYRYTLATGTEREAALVFMEEWAYKAHGCAPPSTTGDIIVATDDTGIVGTVSLDFREDNHPFPLEAIYDFSGFSTQFPFFRRSQIVQGGRWFSKHPKSSVSRELVHTLAEYSLAKGARYLMVEMKDHATARLEELQIQFVVLHGLKPYTEHIPTTGRTYYSTPPLPRPAFAHLESLLITPTLHLLNM